MANKHWVVLGLTTVIILILCWSLRTKRCSSSLLNQQENDIKQTLSDIKKEFFNNEGNIEKEASFKIQKNHINQNRYIYVLDFTTTKQQLAVDVAKVIPHHVFERILEKTGFSKPFRTYFPHPIHEPISEIILGTDEQTKKMYITTKDGKIMAVECKGDGVCYRKEYYFKSTLNKSLLKSMGHPYTNELYDTFHLNPIWEITKESGDMSMHIKVDPLEKNLYPLHHVQLYKWIQHLIPEKKWKEIVKKHRTKYLNILALSKTSITLYVRD